MNWSVHIIKFKEDEKYHKLIADVGGVFNSVDWLSIYPSNLQVMGLYKEDKLVAVWNHWKDKRGPITFYRTPPLMPGNGFTMKVLARNVSAIHSELKNITEQIAFFYSCLKWSVVSLNFPPEVTDLQHFVWKGFKVVPAYTYRMPLILPMEEIMARMSSKLRNTISGAEENGLRCVLETNTDVILKLIHQSLERNGAKQNKEILQRVLNTYSATGNTFAFVCYDGASAIATAFCLMDGKKVFYLMGGYDDQAMHKSGGPFCLYHAILHAKHSGKELFDFEGSMIPVVERFFRGFGADLIPYYSVNKANWLLEMIMKIRMPSKF